MLKNAVIQEQRSRVWAAIQRAAVEASADHESVEDFVDATVAAVVAETGIAAVNVLFTWTVMQIQIAMGLNEKIVTITGINKDTVEPGGMEPNGRG